MCISSTASQSIDLKLQHFCYITEFIYCNIDGIPAALDDVLDKVPF